MTTHRLISRDAVLHQRVENQVGEHQCRVQRRCAERVVAAGGVALSGFEFLADGIADPGREEPCRRLNDDLCIDNHRSGIHLQELHAHHFVLFVIKHDQPTRWRVT